MSETPSTGPGEASSEATPQESKSALWQDWATRTTAILAVLAALSSGRWGASNLQAILEQGKVNDTWAYFQAKSIKQHGAEQTRDLAKALSSAQSQDKAAGLEALERQAAEGARREESEKDQRKKDAEDFQRRRDAMVERGFWFEISFAALQLGVILSTIGAAAKSREIWLASVLFGVIGVLVFVNGFTRTVTAPHSWYSSISDDMSYDVKSPGH